MKLLEMKSKAPSPADIAVMVDELGAIDVRLKAVAQDAKRADEIKKRFRELMNEKPAEAKATIPGSLYMALISERHLEKKVDLDELFRFLGKRDFLAIAKVPIGEIEARVPLEKRAAILTEDRTGPRNVTVVPLQTPAQIKRAA